MSKSIKGERWWRAWEAKRDNDSKKLNRLNKIEGTPQDKEHKRWKKCKNDMSHLEARICRSPQETVSLWKNEVKWGTKDRLESQLHYFSDMRWWYEGRRRGLQMKSMHILHYQAEWLSLYSCQLCRVKFHIVELFESFFVWNYAPFL